MHTKSQLVFFVNLYFVNPSLYLCLMLIQKLQDKLFDRLETNSLRKLVVKKNLVDFFSNDYLGLAYDSSLFESVHNELYKKNLLQNGSTGSRLLSGNSAYAEELENYLAALFKAEKSLIFNSGYNANLSILSALAGKGDTIIYDEYIHASLKDGARLSLANRFSFRHNDLEDLKNKLTRASGEKFIVVESVYSMDGDLAPLTTLVEICEEFGAHLIVDEAHSTGLWGERGEGLCCELGLENKILARVYTFGKAMGMHGACIAGSRILIDFLVNFARPFIYTTALPPHAMVTIRKTFEKSEQMNTERVVLRRKIFSWHKLVKNNLPEKSYSLNESPIQIVLIPGNDKVRRAQEKIQENGIDARAILSPTVKEGEERIRLCLHIYNSEEEMKRLVETLKEVLA